MGRKKTRLTDPRIEPLRRQIERWRRTRTKRSPMPEPLWRAAVALARDHGVYAASQALRLSYDSLRTRTEADGAGRQNGDGAARATFVELGAGPAGLLPLPAGPTVEVTGPSGQRLTVRLRGGEVDLVELIRSCWSGQA